MQCFDLQELNKEIKGQLYDTNIYRKMYSTDASAYCEEPLGVVYPKDKNDLKTILRYCTENNISIIMRAAGTSLAGQVVGNGLVVDISRYMTRIIEIDVEEKFAIVEPGVIRDELNRVLSSNKLFFAPETSTSNRCTISGMVGNNSCGANSLIFGSTRDHIISCKCLLHDGSEVEFGPLCESEFQEKLKLKSAEGDIYRQINTLLSNDEFAKEIEKEYPDKSIRRRNTGYALDELLEMAPFKKDGEKFNLSALIAGSEGTLCIITEIKLKLEELPSPHKGLLCIHLNNIEEALHANLIALKHKPFAVELMDKEIVELTKNNIEQNRNRFFIQGEPGAILIIEIVENSIRNVEQKAQEIENEMRSNSFGIHFPLIVGEKMKQIWALRKAGLGILSNMPGDAKPVPVIEDTAVNPEVLPEYIREFDKILEKYNLNCVYYAHIGTGELHLRPILNLKDKKDVELFYDIALDTAKLVKKFRGSLSGEHGDGRLRGEFIPLMLGDNIYKSFKDIKNIWDPKNIFNPNKIVDTPKMNTSLRYEAGAIVPDIETIFDFSSTGGILRAIEKCNGSGDCRKTHLAGGTMCPSYQATFDEKHVTRARANILREFLTNSDKKNRFNHIEIKEILDLCLSCKACKAECPSNVDVTKFKAEFLHQYHKSHPVPFRTLMIGYFPYLNAMGAKIPSIFNFFASNKFTSYILKKSLGFAPERSIPLVCKTTLRSWAKKNIKNPESPIKTVYLFVDEFTDINDVVIGQKAILLLNKLGYSVKLVPHSYSGRTFLSKGMLKRAKKLAEKNVTTFFPIISNNEPLLGIEPSGILSFRDEYPELVSEELRPQARKLSANCYLIDEFLADEFAKGNIETSKFSSDKKEILFHGHCYQKALASTTPTKIMMQIPENYKVEEIKSGCCGMAGAFGYEKEHYEVSMAVGNLALLPAVRNAHEDVAITATGTSCRHQIKDGASKSSFHPIEILHDALI